MTANPPAPFDRAAAEWRDAPTQEGLHYFQAPANGDGAEYKEIVLVYRKVQNGPWHIMIPEWDTWSHRLEKMRSGKWLFVPQPEALADLRAENARLREALERTTGRVTLPAPSFDVDDEPRPGAEEAAR